jgi:hypothetical protein
MGFGLFAARDIQEGEWFLHEEPAITALFNELDAGSADELQAGRDAYRDAVNKYRDVLILAYPKVAAEFGETPSRYQFRTDTFRDGLAQNLVSGEGSLAAPFVTSGNLEEYLSTMREPTQPSLQDQRRAVRTFFKNYAFQTDNNPMANRSAAGPVRSSKEGCIYLVGSMINHRCHGASRTDRNTGPNADFRVGNSGLTKFIGPNHLAVRARRDIAKDEQITIDYGKSIKDFVCQCQTCQDQKFCAVM